MIEVRSETEADRAAIRAIHRHAFPSNAEADLVERLRADGDAVIALVAATGIALQGHVMFSKMAAPLRALGLGPVAVLAAFRRQGLGARLIEEGLARAREAEWEAVFVLGDPAFYTRFGFSAAQAANFQSPYAGEHLMALSLTGADLASRSGRVDYAPAFGALG